MPVEDMLSTIIWIGMILLRIVILVREIWQDVKKDAAWIAIAIGAIGSVRWALKGVPPNTWKLWLIGAALLFLVGCLLQQHVPSRMGRLAIVAVIAALFGLAAHASHGFATLTVHQDDDDDSGATALGYRLSGYHEQVHYDIPRSRAQQSQFVLAAVPLLLGAFKKPGRVRNKMAGILRDHSHSPPAGHGSAADNEHLPA